MTATVLPASRRPFARGPEDAFLEQPDLAQIIAAWVAQVEEFRRKEALFLAEETYHSKLASHRAALATLIGDGERLKFMWEQSEAPLILSFTKADFEAGLDGLHISFRCQHRPSLPVERKASILALFDEPVPAA